MFYQQALAGWAPSSVSKYRNFFSFSLILVCSFFSHTLCSNCSFPSSTPSSPSHHLPLSPRSTLLYFPSKKKKKLKLNKQTNKKTWLSIKHAYRATIRLDKTLRTYKKKPFCNSHHYGFLFESDALKTTNQSWLRGWNWLKQTFIWNVIWANFGWRQEMGAGKATGVNKTKSFLSGQCSGRNRICLQANIQVFNMNALTAC